MEINPGNLKKSNFLEFQSIIDKNKECYLNSFQKKITDEKGIKYFITIDFYDFNKINKNLGNQYQSAVQFTLKNNFTFNVDGLYNKNLTIQELENFYEKIWNNMDCEYYEYY